MPHESKLSCKSPKLPWKIKILFSWNWEWFSLKDCRLIFDLLKASISMEELYVLQLWIQTCGWVLFARVQNWVRVESKPSSFSVTLAFSHELPALCLSLPPQFFFPMKAICLNSYQLITLYCRNTAEWYK